MILNAVLKEEKRVPLLLLARKAGLSTEVQKFEDQHNINARVYLVTSRGGAPTHQDRFISENGKFW